jgi:cytochrome c
VPSVHPLAPYNSQHRPLQAKYVCKEGTNTAGQKDANGKVFNREFIRTAESKNGSGWVDYMVPKPGETQPAQEWAYVRGVNLGGIPSLVASGFYSDEVEVVR